eukprot:COSAG06_NODE_235_length_19514_cov_33.329333_6_plen_87_part_00
MVGQGLLDQYSHGTAGIPWYDLTPVLRALAMPGDLASGPACTAFAVSGRIGLRGSLRTGRSTATACGAGRGCTRQVPERKTSADMG